MLKYFEKKWDSEMMRLEEVYPSFEWTDKLRDMALYALELGSDHAIDTIKNGALLIPKAKKKTLEQEIPSIQLVDTVSRYWVWGEHDVEVTLKKEESDLGATHKKPVMVYKLTIKGDTAIVSPASEIAEEVCDAWYSQCWGYSMKPTNEAGDESILTIEAFEPRDRHGDFPYDDMPVLLDDIFFGLKKKMESASDA